LIKKSRWEEEKRLKKHLLDSSNCSVWWDLAPPSLIQNLGKSYTGQQFSRLSRSWVMSGKKWEERMWHMLENPIMAQSRKECAFHSPSLVLALFLISVFGHFLICGMRLNQPVSFPKLIVYNSMAFISQRRELTICKISFNFNHCI
jgi:hypothetical protein